MNDNERPSPPECVEATRDALDQGRIEKARDAATDGRMPDELRIGMDLGPAQHT